MGAPFPPPDDAPLLRLTEIMQATGVDPADFAQAIDAVIGAEDVAALERALRRVERYRWEPVPFTTFVTSPLYLGLTVGDNGDIWTKTMDLLVAAAEGEYEEIVLTGGTGYGKTLMAEILLARMIYELSCLANPQPLIGLARDSAIVCVLQSITADKARKVIFGDLSTRIRRSPYFQTVFPFNPRIASELQFPHNVRVSPIAGIASGALGENVIGGILDESNFMAVVQDSRRAIDPSAVYSAAVTNYNVIATRRKGRYQQTGQKLPGWLMLVSSKRTVDDFTEQKIAEARVNPRIFVIDEPQWSTRPVHRYSAQRFRVLVGVGTQRSRILADDEVAPPDERVIEPPEDFRLEFERDIDQAVRDIGGCSTQAIHRFFGRPEKVAEMFVRGHRQQPFSASLSTLEDSLQVLASNLCLTREDRARPRACHIDLGLNRLKRGGGRGDHAAISFGFVRRMVECVRTPLQQAGIPPEQRLGLVRRIDGAIVERLPYIVIEGSLRIAARPGDEVQIEAVCNLIVALRDAYHVPIKWVTADSYQSVQMLQTMRNHGFAAGDLSVDEDPRAYNDLRQAVYDDRVESAPHAVAQTELIALERRMKDGKVDHPQLAVNAKGQRVKGSKDVADTMAGVVHFLVTRRESWTVGVAERRPNPARPQ